MKNAFLKFTGAKEETLWIEIERGFIGLLIRLKNGPRALQSGSWNLRSDLGGSLAIELVFQVTVFVANCDILGIAKYGQAQRHGQGQAMDRTLRLRSLSGFDGDDVGLRTKSGRNLMLRGGL